VIATDPGTITRVQGVEFSSPKIRVVTLPGPAIAAAAAVGGRRGSQGERSSWLGFGRIDQRI
jgi:hypothetical protein